MVDYAAWEFTGPDGGSQDTGAAEKALQELTGIELDFGEAVSK